MKQKQTETTTITTTTIDDIAEQRPLARAIHEVIPQEQYVLRALCYQQHIKSEIVDAAYTAGKYVGSSAYTFLGKVTTPVGTRAYSLLARMTAPVGKVLGRMQEKRNERNLKKISKMPYDSSLDTVELNLYRRRKK